MSAAGPGPPLRRVHKRLGGFKTAFTRCFATRSSFQQTDDDFFVAPLFITAASAADASTAPSRVRGCVCTQEASPPKFPPIQLAMWPAQEVTKAGKNNTHWILHCWLR